jgi:hypothetical protein
MEAKACRMSSDRLPPEAQIRLEALRGAARDAEAMVHAAQAAIADCEHRLGAARHRFDAAGGEKAQAAAAAVGRALEAELERLRNAAAKRWERRTNTAQLCARIDHWLGTTPGSFELADAVAVVVPDGGWADAVEAVRDQREAHEAEVMRLRSAPLPVAELCQRARAMVDALAATGPPAIDMRGGDLSIRWRTRDAGSPNMTAADTTALLAWLHRDALQAALEQAITKAAPATGGIPAAGRAEREEELLMEIERCEFEEEALIEAAQAAGVEVPRRVRASPQAVLGIRPASRVVRAA